jgi:hypothetical protein
MSVRDTRSEGKSALFCSSSGWAFGPVFNSRGEVRSFLRWYDKQHGLDLRLLSDRDLESLHSTWRTYRDAKLAEKRTKEVTR